MSEKHAPSASDFHEDVEGVGLFRFAKRSMRDEIKINVEYSRLTEGVGTPTPYLDLICTWLSTLRVLTVDAPDGWDLDTMEPLEDETYSKLMKVYGALRAKEGSFRRKPTEAVTPARANDVAEHGVLVPQKVQPSAN